jgi:uncharacterized membrane protein
MAALAYALLPVTGLAAYLLSSSARVRLHGLQAVTLGLVWPAALYACAALSRTATQIAFFVGAVVWLVLLVSTAFGKDVHIPLLGRWLARAAANPPR